MLESLGMLSAIVQRAGEGEMERGAVADVDGDRDPLANLGHVGVGQHLALDAGEAPPGFAEFIVERRRLAIAGDRRFHLARGAGVIDRKRVGEGKRGSGSVTYGCCRHMKKKTKTVTTCNRQ